MNAFDVRALERGVTLSAAIEAATDEESPAPDGFVRIAASDALWTGLAKGCAQGWHDLGALWFDGGSMHMALWQAAGGHCQKAIVSIEARHGVYPSVSAHHVPAMRLERAMRDLYDVNPMGLPDTRGWLDHGVWPAKPLRTEKGYQFLPVDGAGLHQIPVGPVHAGIIEPGHFRFTCNGETVARLEERLGYVHKGVESLCAGAPLAQAGKIAARISGDSTVAYSFAFALAAEAALGWDVPPRAILLRGIMAELERLSHHVSDVGAICNDASVVAILARCAIIREDILATAAECFGHRMMMDRIVPGGTACDLDDKKADAIRALLVRLEASFAGVVNAYDQSPSLQDRVQKTGCDAPGLCPAVRRGRICRPRLGPRLRRAPGVRLCAVQHPRIRGAVADRWRRGCAHLDPDRGSLAKRGHDPHSCSICWSPARWPLRRLTCGRAMAPPSPRRSGATCSSACGSARTATSRICMPATPPGSNGRFWRRRSRTTSSPTSRSAISRSTAPIPGTTSS